MQDFDQFYLKHCKSVRRYIRAFIWDEETIMEVMQETFLVAHRKWEEVSARDDPGMRRWLIRTAEYCVKDWRRKNVPRILREVSIGEEEEFFLDRAERVEISSGLEELFTPEVTIQERIVLTAYYQDGHTIPDIARHLGVSQDAVKKRLERGRKHLKKELDLSGKIL